VRGPRINSRLYPGLDEPAVNRARGNFAVNSKQKPPPSMCFWPGLKIFSSHRVRGKPHGSIQADRSARVKTTTARPNASRLAGSAQCASSKIISTGFLRANVSMAGAFIFAASSDRRPVTWSTACYQMAPIARSEETTTLLCTVLKMKKAPTLLRPGLADLC
jgi:hypothetical protein